MQTINYYYLPLKIEFRPKNSNLSTVSLCRRESNSPRSNLSWTERWIDDVDTSLQSVYVSCMGLCKLYIRRFITAVARAGRKWMGVLDGIGMAMVNLSHVYLSWHLVTFVGDESQKGRRNGVWRHSDVFIWRKNVQVKQVKTNLQTIA